jgi:hypothetical protein
MDSKEFNIKYNVFLEKGFPGLLIEESAFVDHLDKFFSEVTKIKGFKYYKISQGNHSTLVMKTNLSRILPSLGWIIENKIEEDLSYTLQIEKEVQRRLNQKIKIK